jgi:probable phosphoglycerate mutase
LQNARVPREDTRLILIRHGESRASVDRVVGGHRACQGLTDRGRAQAEALRERLQATREVEADALFSSVLPRAIETAEILSPALSGLKPERDCDLCELHPGECDGLGWGEYRERYGFDMTGEPERPMSPGGESLRSFQARVDRRIERLLEDHDGQTLVIVCHGGVISAVMLRMLGHALHVERPFRLETENTSLSEWLRPGDHARQPGRWVLVRYNDAAHLA